MSNKYASGQIYSSARQINIEHHILYQQGQRAISLESGIWHRKLQAVLALWDVSGQQRNDQMFKVPVLAS